MMGPYGWLSGFKKMQEEVEKMERDKLLKDAKYTCTYCGEKAWYIGLNLIECSNKKCKWYCDRNNSSNNN